jgi:ATP-dependent helicase/nuclease subunit B
MAASGLDKVPAFRAAVRRLAELGHRRIVLLTRALKADGASTIASRWLQRLEQLTHGLKLDAQLVPSHDYAQLAARMVEVPRTKPIARPAPRPPVAARPRRLSVTEIETWLRDPYAIYAKHVLKMRPLEALDEPVGPLMRGTALHKAMEEFVLKYPGELPEDAVARLCEIADAVFAHAGIPKAALAVWRPRFRGAAQGFIAVERERRGGIDRSFVEKHGTRTFPSTGGDFVLSGQADRIDIRKDGKAAILDYKTGATPTPPQVEELLAPQLPLEAAILSEGGFPEIGKRLTEELIYLSLADGKKAARPVQIDNAQGLAVEAAQKLAQRISRFDDKDTPYLSRVRPYRTDSVGDYDHLARVREWSLSGGEDS